MTHDTIGYSQGVFPRKPIRVQCQAFAIIANLCLLITAFLGVVWYEGSLAIWPLVCSGLGQLGKCIILLLMFYVAVECILGQLVSTFVVIVYLVICIWWSHSESLWSPWNARWKFNRLIETYCSWLSPSLVIGASDETRRRETLIKHAMA
jgi:hypothetical protein